MTNPLAPSPLEWLMFASFLGTITVWCILAREAARRRGGGWSLALAAVLATLPVVGPAAVGGAYLLARHRPKT